MQENLNLGERWTHVCQWINEKSSQLKEMLSNEKKVAEECEKLIKWLGDTETKLKKMEAEPEIPAEIPKIMERVNHMKQINREIVENSERLTRLTLAAEKLDESEVDGEAAGFLGSLETSQDRLDALKSILEVQAQRIRLSGFEVDFEGIISPAHSADEEDDESHFESKKRKINSKRVEFDQLAGELESWLDCWETLLEESLAKVGKKIEGMEKHQELLEEANKDFKSHKQDFESVIELGQNVLQDLKNDKEAKQAEQKKLSMLTSRWNAMEGMLRDTNESSKRLELEEQERYISEMRDMKKAIDENQKWLERSQRKKAIDLFDELIEKMKVLKSGKDNVAALNEKIPESDDLLFTYNTLLSKFDSFLNDKVNEYVKTLEGLISSIEEEYMSDVPLTMEVECHVAKLEELRRELNEHTKKIDGLFKINTFPQLLNLQTRWAQMCNLTEEKEKSLKRNFELLKNHCSNISTVDEQLKMIENLKNRSMNLSNIKSTMEEYKSRIEEVERASSTLQNSLKEIVTLSDPELKDFLINEVNKISNKIDLLKEHSQEMDTIMKFANEADDYSEFLKGVEAEVEKTEEVTSTEQLSQARSGLAQSEDKLESTNEVLDNLRCYENEMSDVETDMVGEKLKELTERKEELLKKVKERHKILDKASQQYGEFKALVAQETDWLDKLEKRLRKSPESAADAEDISEELDVSLKNFLSLTLLSNGVI